MGVKVRTFLNVPKTNNVEKVTVASAIGGASVVVTVTSGGLADAENAWAALGECDINPNFMRTSCERACAAHAAFRASLVGLPPAPAPPSEGEVKQAEELQQKVWHLGLIGNK